MANASPSGHAGVSAPQGATGVIVLASGDVIWGRGFGATGAGVGETCFNTSMTGYQEIMTDPSYAGQIVTFTFPHIGNVGTNAEDMESDKAAAVGCLVREDVTGPSNFRSQHRFDEWLAARGQIGISGIDTRALTRLMRESGAPNAVIAHSPDGQFDMDELLALARDYAGLEGMDLAKDVTRADQAPWQGGIWHLGHGYDGDGADPRPLVVAVDFGAKNNIFRNLVHAGAKVTVVPATTSAEDILALNPAGVFLSNGPGDPAATGDYAVPVIRKLLDANMPIFGICLGHQLLAIAVGGRTIKMHQGHRGANHPVQHHSDNVVEITSMNHGFTVDATSLPTDAVITHTSLFDGSNCGFEIPAKKAFSVQYHPEASPGPQDSLYLFDKFLSGLKN